MSGPGDRTRREGSPPSPDGSRRLRHSRRGALSILLAFFTLGADGNLPDRIAFDAWATPPAYTGLPARRLPDGAEDEGQPADTKPIELPAGSRLLVRLGAPPGRPEAEPAEIVIGSARSALTPREDGSMTLDIPLGRAEDAAAETPIERNISLVQGGRRLASWQVALVPDRAPRVRAKISQVTRSGAIRLDYALSDDYGVEAVWLHIERDRESDDIPRAVPGAEADSRGPFPLDSPPAGSRGTEETRFLDLTNHRWAGEAVTLLVSGVDAAGQRGESAPLGLVLPERRFFHPVARALSRQRRALLESPENRRPVARIISALAAKPDKFRDDTTAFLALTTAAHRLIRQKSAEEVRSAADLLWDTALRIEDGELAEARERLRDVFTKAKDALSSRAAPDAAGERLEALAKALDAYILAIRNHDLETDGLPAATPLAAARALVSEEPPRRLLEEIASLARMGRLDEAGEELVRLEAVAENIRLETPAEALRRAGTQHAAEGLDALTNLIGRQEALMDESDGGDGGGTFAFPGTQDSGRWASEAAALARAQKRLRDALRRVLRTLDEGGHSVPRALGAAERAMGEAARALDSGLKWRALDAQSKALQNLRDGAQSLVQGHADGANVPIVPAGGSGLDPGPPAGGRHVQPPGAGGP